MLAMLVSPLARLPFRIAFFIYTVLQFASLFCAVRLLGSGCCWIATHTLEIFAAGLIFYPVMIAVTGGQNTALTLLLLAAVYELLRRQRPIRAGFVLGLLSYKPQFGLIFGVLLLCGGHWRSAMTAASVAVGHYAVGSLVCGWDWPVHLSRAIATYWPLEHAFNGTKAISIIGIVEQLLGTGGHLLGIQLSCVLMILLAWFWCDARPGNERFHFQFAAAIAGATLISPHTIWYDSGLAFAAAILILGHVRDRTTICICVVAFVAAATHPWRDTLGWHPAIISTLLMAAIAFLRGRIISQCENVRWLPQARALSAHNR